MRQGIVDQAVWQRGRGFLPPKLRFPEFQGDWEWAKVDALVDTITPPKKLPTSSYGRAGEFPIIDQSRNEICGWTDDQGALIKDHLPLVVFGDHTCILKLVDRPFAQGADGIKIIKTRARVTVPYLYQYLNYRPVITEEYKRHFSILKEKMVVFPAIKTGEQQKIADCLSYLDELIAAQARKVEALKSYKKWLVQQIFPCEGKSQPRLRFPEFRLSRPWVKDLLGELFETASGGTPSRSNSEYWGGGIPWVTTTQVNFGIIRETDEFISENGLRNSSAKLFPQGTVLIAMYGQGKTRGQVALLGIEAATNQACAAVLPVKKIDSRFVFFNLSGRYDELRRLSNSGGQENLSQGIIREIPIAYPLDEAEQQRIVSCLQSLDDFVTAAVRQLDALKIHKNGLMQQIFPSLEDDV